MHVVGDPGQFIGVVRETRDETPKSPRMVGPLLIVLQFKKLLYRLKTSKTSWKTKVTTMLKSF